MLAGEIKGAEIRRINVGCGYDKRPDYLNVDMDPACAPDILVSDIEFSNLPRQAFDDLIAYDVLEHIHRADTPGALLEWADLLADGGVMELETSNVMAIVDMMRSEDTYAQHCRHTIMMFGNQCHAGDYHHTGFTERTLKVQVLSAGFEIEKFEIRQGWLFWLRARKVADWTRLLAADINDQDFVVEAWREALNREPEICYRDGLRDQIAQGQMTRRAVLKYLHASEERRLGVAHRHGL